MNKILIIEDDAAVRKGLEEILKSEHYDVISAQNGEKGYSVAKQGNIDLIILDLLLPGINGIEICNGLRKDGIKVPILMLTSKAEEADKVIGLEIGADDYMTKPFSFRELTARVKALLRRTAGEVVTVDEYSFGTIELNFKKQEACRKRKKISLSSKEFEVLKYLIQHEGEVVSRHMLLDAVWGFEQDPTTRTVDNYILSLRKNIEDDPRNPKHILTIHSAGYKFTKGD